MKNLVLLAFLCLSVSAFSQDKTEDVPQQNVYGAALQLGDLFNFGNKAVKFREVISDSRCPKDVTCVWAGEAKVLVEVFENGNFLGDKIIIINEGPSILNFSVENIVYSIVGMNLSPYPTAGCKKIKPEYTLQMQITEKL